MKQIKVNHLQIHSVFHNLMLIEIEEIIKYISIEMLHNQPMRFAFRSMVNVKEEFFELGFFINHQIDNEG